MKMAIPSICACTDSPLVGVRADALYSAGFRPKVWPAAVCAGLYFVSGTLHWIRELSLSLPECKTSSLTTRSDYFRTGRPRYMLTLTISMYSKYSFVTSGTMIFMLLHSNCTRLRIPYYIQSRRQRLLPPVVSATEHRTSSHLRRRALVNDVLQFILLSVRPQLSVLGLSRSSDSLAMRLHRRGLRPPPEAGRQPRRRGGQGLPLFALFAHR